MTQTLRKHEENKSMMNATIQRVGLHKESRIISKIQPKIRIIHIFAPEIIHTDVAHFSETVQRLTGKASSTTKATPTGSSLKKSVININSNSRATKLPIENDHQYDHGGFLEAFQGVNCGFLQEIAEFPLVSMEAINNNHHHHHHLNVFGDSLSYRG